MALKRHSISILQVAVMALVVGWGLTACSDDSWKEEVLLHDGQTIIVERYQTYKGNSEIGQPTPVGEHTIRFKLPATGKQLSWTSEYGDDLGRTNFKLIALHLVKDTPFLVAVPNLCLAYNKWGRPNPPYVVFKHDGTNWVRAALGDLPTEFNSVNMVINNQGEAKILSKPGLVSAEFIRKLNGELEQPQYKTILRNPLPEQTMCEKMVYYKCGWISPESDFGKQFMDRSCK